VHHIAAYDIYRERAAALEREARMRTLVRRKERRRLSLPALLSSKPRSKPQLEPSCGGC